ncbi:MAG: ABC transporter substrate-binding protein [Actinomycetia bacterium]|nr:ABC transporter substrate-binding protein [Actinomycetes bacterium]
MSASTARILGMIDEVYYTPQIVAFRLGFFRDEGLDAEFTVGDITELPRAVTVGEADFALCGLWQPWLYAERLNAPLAAFAELNQQVPLFLFGRVPAEEFDWSSLNGGTVHHTSVMVASRWCALQELFRRRASTLEPFVSSSGVSPPRRASCSGLAAATCWSSSALARRRCSPTRTLITLSAGGTDLGTLPWSIYYTSRDRLRDRRREAVAVTRAPSRALQWVSDHSAEEITQVVAPSFPTVDEADVHLLVEFFLAQEQWPATPAQDRESDERWRGLLMRSGVLAHGAPRAEIVAEEIAAEAIAG